MTFFRRTMPVLLLVGTAAHAQSFQDLPELEMRLMAALGAGIGEPGGPARPIDRRLKLASCPQPVEIEAPALGAVTVRCQSHGWRIRVPLVRAAAPAATAAAEVAAKPEPIVRKGDQVELTASAGSFTVSTVAIAEQDGAAGDRIRVRSERKSAAVIGLVQADGRVSLPGFK